MAFSWIRGFIKKSTDTVRLRQLNLEKLEAREVRAEAAVHAGAEREVAVVLAVEHELVGPFEHHSNELPWRETIADVVVIPEDADGHISLEVLEQRLHEYADRPLRIGIWPDVAGSERVDDAHAVDLAEDSGPQLVARGDEMAVAPQLNARPEARQ